MIAAKVLDTWRREGLRAVARKTICKIRRRFVRPRPRGAPLDRPILELRTQRAMAHWRSGASFEKTSAADPARAYPSAPTMTYPRLVCPKPTGVAFLGCHRSNCAISPGRYEVR